MDEPNVKKSDLQAKSLLPFPGNWDAPLCHQGTPSAIEGKQ